MNTEEDRSQQRLEKLNNEKIAALLTRVNQLDVHVDRLVSIVVQLAKSMEQMTEMLPGAKG